MPEFQHFNPITVPLQASNLIEASAGTGKTYSIGILVLRLLLEKKLPVREILMVTFTKAAVAELQERIRLFVREAYRSTGGEAIEDKTIALLVQREMDRSGRDAVLNTLKDAVLCLDETSVMTIHSFCQATLTEFAFDTGQLFGANTVQDSSGILQEQIDKFWRRHVTTLPPVLLKELLESGFSRKRIAELLKCHLGGKRYYPYDSHRQYASCLEDQLRLVENIGELRAREEYLRHELYEEIEDTAKDLEQRCRQDHNAVKSLLPLLHDQKAFAAKLLEKRSTGYVQKLFQHLLAQCNACEQMKQQRLEAVDQFIDDLLFICIQATEKGVAEYKLQNNQMTFDDMIVYLHAALSEGSEQLIAGLRSRFKAVFIDEFQDTDRLQYEIFRRAFGQQTILFYIGDPKQSIYAFRTADIHTYFKAYTDADHVYGMNQNYRSSERMIRAMNLLFQPHETFDTFHFQDPENGINYIQVESPVPNTKGCFVEGEAEVAPISISRFHNQDAICQAVVAQVAELLENKAYGIKRDTCRPIRPSDIGILVYSNHEGRAIKQALAKRGIPCVTIGDDKILQSAEAMQMLYILYAMADISRSSINRALLSPITGFGQQEIIQLNEELALEQFKRYKELWQTSGIYTALMAFVSDYQVKQVLLQEDRENGERIITNFYQLIELLHQTQNARNFSPLELISWLKRGIEGLPVEGDVYELRVESDEESVKIVTIHKSKGLEYNIVLAPNLDFRGKIKETCTFHDEVTEDYVTIRTSRMEPAQQAMLDRQQEQEHRRLFYVAITRAVYKCFIFKNNHFKHSTLSTFLHALQYPDPLLIEFTDVPELAPNYRYRSETVWTPPAVGAPVHFSLLEPNWMRMSYSRLRAEHLPARRERTQNNLEEYDRFVFHELAGGIHTGNMLHDVFEHVPFHDDSQWQKVIRDALTRFIPVQAGSYLPRLGNLVEHALRTDIPVEGGPIRLVDIHPHRRINEFEFDFPVITFDTALLEELSDEKRKICAKTMFDIEGLMNGKIDLFFEHHGRYYVLDWKSNFLGDRLEDYSPEALSVAMNESNYHLQYLLYCLAARKYLQSRLPAFDYKTHFGGAIYLFLRGVRKGSDTGIYYRKPSAGELDFLEQILCRDVNQLSGSVSNSEPSAV